MWAPRLFRYYSSRLQSLINHDDRNQTNFPNSVWAAATFNFGPNTVCFKHKDYANLPFGWCGVTSLGNFNPTLGGHLVLWDLHLVVEFPAGSTILLPSAAITHSNVPINVNAGERRFSFTQYTAGGVFRWVDQGFQKTEQFKGRLAPEELRETLKTLSAQLDMGLGLFSTLDELRKEATDARVSSDDT